MIWAVLALASAVALTLSFPGFDLWPLAWVALVPLFAVYRSFPVRQSVLATIVTGAAFFGALLYWVAIFGHAPWILLSIFQAAFFVAFGLASYPLFRSRAGWARLILVPAIWVALEWLRSLGSFGFTWGDLAQSQTRFLHFIQMGSVTGPWGPAFVIVAANVALADLLLLRSMRAFLETAIVAVLVCAAALGGASSMRAARTPGERLSVALIQGNVEQELKPGETWEEHTRYAVSAYGRATLEAMKRRPNLIVWAETAIPGHLLGPDSSRWVVETLARVARAHLLVGSMDKAPRVNGKERDYNGAYMFGPDGTLLGTYYKTHLVPFGEFVPGRGWLPFLQRYKIRAVDIAPGPGYRPLEAEFGRTGVMICFESIFPYIARTIVRRGASVMVVMTNDAWFERTLAAEQHHAMSILRAVENRRYVARCAATGVSSVIDPWGRVRGATDIFEAGIVYGEMVPLKSQTFYSRFGDWFAYLCAALAAASLTRRALRRILGTRRAAS